MAAPGARSATSKPPVKHHPHMAQAKRSWYFFRRNSLAMVGLSILVLIAVVAVYAYTQPIPWFSMDRSCATDYGPDNPSSGYPGAFNSSSDQGCSIICTYSATLPSNAADFCHGLWFKTPINYASVVGPTFSTKPLTLGPLPMGALSTGIDSAPLYNLFSILLRGSDWSLLFSVGIVGIGAMIGLLVGAYAGYYGGIVDDALMRLVDIFLSIPVILFVVVVVIVASLRLPDIGSLGAANTKLLIVVLAFAATWWPFYARLVRGQVLVVREQKYVEAAWASGASRPRILARHIIPNSVYPIFIQFSLDVGTIPLLIGSLAYLGFGPQLFPNKGLFPEWGNIAQLGVAQITSILGTCTDPSGCIIPWWQLFFPGLMLFFFAVSVNLLSDGLRDTFDPRLRR